MARSRSSHVSAKKRKSRCVDTDSNNEEVCSVSKNHRFSPRGKKTTADTKSSKPNTKTERESGKNNEHQKRPASIFLRKNNMPSTLLRKISPRKNNNQGRSTTKRTKTVKKSSSFKLFGPKLYSKAIPNHAANKDDSNGLSILKDRNIKNNYSRKYTDPASPFDFELNTSINTNTGEEEEEEEGASSFSSSSTATFQNNNNNNNIHKHKHRFGHRKSGSHPVFSTKHKKMSVDYSKDESNLRSHKSSQDLIRDVAAVCRPDLKSVNLWSTSSTMDTSFSSSSSSSSNYASNSSEEESGCNPDDIELIPEEEKEEDKKPESSETIHYCTSEEAGLKSDDKVLSKRPSGIDHPDKILRGKETIGALFPTYSFLRGKPTKKNQRYHRVYTHLNFLFF